MRELSKVHEWLLAGLIAILTTTPSLAAVRYVKSSATGANNGTSWAEAYADLQSALSAANAGDQIWVSAGTYTPTQRTDPLDPKSVTFQLLNGVTLYGGFSGTETSLSQRNVALNQTILSGDLNAPDLPDFDEATWEDNAAHVVTVNDVDNTAVLDGFVVTHGYGITGVGMWASPGGPTVLNCTFIKNWARLGAAYAGSPAVGAASFINCRFLSNRSATEGGAVNCRRTTFTNCLFSGNFTTHDVSSGGAGGGAIACGSGTTLINCTLANNSTAANGGALSVVETVNAYNCIIWGNMATQRGSEIMLGESSTLNIYWSTLPTNVPGWLGYDSLGHMNFSNLTTTYPLYRNPVGPDGQIGTPDDDYTLLPFSPCIDAGNNDVLPMNTFDLLHDGQTAGPLPIDLAGNPRQIDDPAEPDTGTGSQPLVDQGAYESSSDRFFLFDEPVVISEGTSASVGVHLAWDPRRSVNVTVAFESGDTDISVHAGEMLTFDSSNYLTPQIVALAAAVNGNTILDKAVFRIESPGYPPSFLTAHGLDAGVAWVVYVKSDAPAGGDGLRWNTAFRDLEQALTFVRNSHGAFKQIWVSAGTYTPTQRTDPLDPKSVTFQLLNGVTLYGGFSGTETSLSQRNVALNQTILSGDLNAPDLPDFDEATWEDNAAHVVTVNDVDNTAVLDGFVVTHGYGITGVGMWASPGGPTVLNCTFIKNWARLGAAYAGSPAVGAASFINCRFLSNRSATEGGAVNCRRTTFTNCLFSGNFTTHDVSSGGAGGGAIACGSGTTLINCTLANNSTAANGGALSVVETVNAYNCIIWGNMATQRGSEIMLGESSTLNIYWSTLPTNVPGWLGYDSLGHMNFSNLTTTYPLYRNPVGPDGQIGTPDDDYALLPFSPCIDAGNNAFVSIGIDAFGNMRRVDDPTALDTGAGISPLVDHGAYEFGSSPISSRAYVRSTAIENGTMTGWNDAASDLQFALNTALASGGHVTHIWVAGGTYKATSAGGDRAIAFRLLPGVGLYGGFAGTESTLSERDLFNPVNSTILSGDLNDDDTPFVAGQPVPASWNENSIHVVDGSGAEVSSILDSFTIRSGYADGSSGYQRDRGAGLYLAPGRPTLRNLRLVDNIATTEGGDCGAISHGCRSTV